MHTQQQQHQSKASCCRRCSIISSCGNLQHNPLSNRHVLRSSSATRTGCRAGAAATQARGGSQQVGKPQKTRWSRPTTRSRVSAGVQAAAQHDDASITIDCNLPAALMVCRRHKSICRGTHYSSACNLQKSVGTPNTGRAPAKANAAYHACSRQINPARHPCSSCQSTQRILLQCKHVTVSPRW